MRRATLPSFLIGSLLIILGQAVVLGQTADQNPYKQTLDRLSSLTVQNEPDWRFHEDIPHPEDPAVSDADWGTWKVSPNATRQTKGEHWTGTRVFRRWIEIPEKMNGY